MINKKEIRAVINYRDFLRFSSDLKKELYENEAVEFLISIKKEEYKNLSAEDKEKLRGFRRTEREPLRKMILDKEKIFTIKEIPATPKIVLQQSFKEKHKKQSKPHCPRNLINKNYNSKKKGGR